MGCTDNQAEVRVKIGAELPERSIDVLQRLPPEVFEISHHQYIDLLFEAIPGPARTQRYRQDTADDPGRNNGERTVPVMSDPVRSSHLFTGAFPPGGMIGNFKEFRCRFPDGFNEFIGTLPVIPEENRNFLIGHRRDLPVFMFEPYGDLI